MEQSSPVNQVVTAVGVAGGAALLAPIAAPTLHGLAGIAVVGLGVFATGSAVYNAAGFLNEKGSELLGNQNSRSKPPVKQVPFNK